MTAATTTHDVDDRGRLVVALAAAVVLHVVARSVGVDGVIAAVLGWIGAPAPSWGGGPLDALGWLTVDLGAAGTLTAAVSWWLSSCRGCRYATAVFVEALAIVVTAPLLVEWILR